MAKQPKWFLKTRLMGIWILLTKRHVVVLGSNNKGDISCRYNVTHESFRLMCRFIDPAYEEAEGQKAALAQAQDILG
jgi:hypothetical protein